MSFESNLQEVGIFLNTAVSGHRFSRRVCDGVGLLQLTKVSLDRSPDLNFELTAVNPISGDEPAILRAPLNAREISADDGSVRYVFYAEPSIEVEQANTEETVAAAHKLIYLAFQQ